MAKTKLSEAVEEKTGKKKEEPKKAVKPEAKETPKDEINEPIAEELQEETQGAEGKSPDQIIEENLVMLMNLDHTKLDTKQTGKAIAHLALIVLVLKKTLDKDIAQTGQHSQDIGSLAQEHQAAQAQHQQSLLDLHNRIGAATAPKQPKQPAQPAQPQPMM